MALSKAPSTPSKSINQRIYSAIYQDIWRERTGYIIESQEADGCDEMGIKYWISCRNGWGARSWDLFPEKKKKLEQILASYHDNGITINGKVYHSSKKNNFESMMNRIVRKTKFLEETYSKTFKSY